MDFPLSWILRSPSVCGRRAGFLDGGAGSFALRTCPHFRHVLTRASLVDAATQHGAFPLRSVVWIRPASLLVRQRSGAFCSDPVPEYLAPIRLLAPLQSEFRLRLYPPLPLGAFRPGFALPVSRPFVCECRTIPAIPSRWTTPGLP